ncbi:hypothetical protein HY374_03235 [Candidatus Berkelbacteria bacterium]|nr:hypothetical protein [Candidatus Berkelbacteria bacterium]
MNAVEKFRQLAAEPRFQGWPLVGVPVVFAGLPYFGAALKERRETPNGVEEYFPLQRTFYWMVTFGITVDGLVPTLCQWKMGVNGPSWELPPGGVGKFEHEPTSEELMARTQEIYLRETGFGGGEWAYLGYTLIETGKFRGPTPQSRGLKAHMSMATGLESVQAARAPLANEIMETLLVPLGEFRRVLESGLFTEISAALCARAALEKLGLLRWAE